MSPSNYALVILHSVHKQNEQTLGKISIILHSAPTPQETMPRHLEFKHLHTVLQEHSGLLSNIWKQNQHPHTQMVVTADFERTHCTVGVTSITATQLGKFTLTVTRGNKRIPTVLDGSKRCGSVTSFALGMQEWATSLAAEANINIQTYAHSKLCIPHSPKPQLPALSGMTLAILILGSGRVTSSP